MQENIYKRIAFAEAMANTQKAEMMDVLQEAYKRACDELNEEDAAMLVRKIRNKLLDNSDMEMCLDRLGLDLSSVTKFISSLSRIRDGAWARYRQALRDLPTQEGFPFDVEFPTPPNNESFNC